MCYFALFASKKWHHKFSEDVARCILHAVISSNQLHQLERKNSLQGESRPSKLEQGSDCCQGEGNLKGYFVTLAVKKRIFLSGHMVQ